MSVGFLLVRAERRPYGLPLDRVVEVADLTEVLDVPHSDAAVRGLTPLRGRLVPLVHLGALLGLRAPPPERGAPRSCWSWRAASWRSKWTTRMRSCAWRRCRCPTTNPLPWAVGVAPRGDGLVPILDLDALGERIG